MFTTWLPLAAEGKDAGFDWAPVWATLLGVAATGLFAIISQGMNQRSAKKQAEFQAKHEIGKWHRELRRQSYADCIVAYEKYRDMLEALAFSLPWSPAPPIPQEAEDRITALVATLNERYEELFKKCQIVRLEGPENISNIAQGLIDAADEFRDAVRNRRGVKTQNAAMRRAAVDDWNRAAKRMREGLEEFINTARSVIAVD